MPCFPAFRPASSLKRPTLALLTLAFVAGSCRTNDEATTPTPAAGTGLSAAVATQWADLSLKLIRSTPGFSPPVAARALGYAGLTIYESVVPGLPEHQSLAGQLNGLSRLPQPEVGQAYHWGLSANAAQASILKNLFANTSAANKLSVDSLQTAFTEQFRKNEKLSQEVVDRSVVFGQRIATAIFEWSKTDKGHEGYARNLPADYVPPVGPGKWVQTTAGDAGRALQPYWGQNRTFLASNARMPPPAPLAFGTSASSPFFVQALEVYSTGKNLSEEQKTIAKFWADGGGTITPPGHSWNLTTLALRKSNADLGKAAEAYARVGIAVNDAFICCWKCKYTYNLVRPVSYIRSVIDANWTPLLPTPNFPEHLSGHSTQSGAAAQVLSDAFGYSFAFSDSTHLSRGFAPRAYKTFFEASEEAAVSRLYGGIHFRQANEVGLSEGRKIGRNVSALKFRRAL